MSGPDSTSAAARSERVGLAGFACAFAAYLIWGLSPIYWKAVQNVPAFEILMHRIVWSLPFLVPVLLAQRRWPDVVRALKCRRSMAFLLVTTLLLAVNWFLFVWAINTNRVLQTSLGYFMNPLVSVVLGVVFLGERLRRLDLIAVALAVIGVLNLLVLEKGLPWLPLALATTFGAYGLLRKVAPVGSLAGLTVEVLILSVPAAAYIIYQWVLGKGVFLRTGATTDLLLVLSWIVTAFPLWLFILGARRLRLATVGFLQYISPSCSFLLAVLLWREPLGAARLVTFVLIWSALAVYSLSRLRDSRAILSRVARQERRHSPLHS